MPALSEREVGALAGFVAELGATEDVEPFTPYLLSKVGAIVGTPNVSYCELDRIHERLLGSVEGDGASELDGYHEDFWRLIRTHPTCAHRWATGDWTRTRKVSDFVTRRRLRRTELWSELYRDHPFDDWIDVGLAPERGCTHMFLVTRERGDFAEHHRLVLDLLQPHLQRRYDHVRTTADAVGALASLVEDVGDGVHPVVLCSRDGVVQFASATARRLLAEFVGIESGRVPRTFLRTEPLVVERRDRRLTLRPARVGDVVVLLLDERDLRLDRLTPRQRDVLARLALGETDAEIAEALGVARRTISTHLHEIYARLGVRTRTAAAAISVSAAPGTPRATQRHAAPSRSA